MDEGRGAGDASEGTGARAPAEVALPMRFFVRSPCDWEGPFAGTTTRLSADGMAFEFGDGPAGDSYLVAFHLTDEEGSVVAGTLRATEVRAGVPGLVTGEFQGLGAETAARLARFLERGSR